MPLPENGWETFKRAVDLVFRDVGRELAVIAHEAQALLRLSQGRDGRDLPGTMAVVLELSAETILERVRATERRLTLFLRDVEDLRGGREL